MKIRPEIPLRILDRSARSRKRPFKAGLLILLIFLVITSGIFIVLIGNKKLNTEITSGIGLPNCTLWQISADNEKSLLLVNQWNPLSKDYTVKLRELQDGQSIDKRCYVNLKKMISDCEAAGLKPLVCSSYRSPEKQQQLFNDQVNKLLFRGYELEDARKEAGTAVATPGTSEHQTGLAVDIVDANYQELDETQSSTPTQQWLIANSWRYGFILRYPPEKSEITGIIYEPWHYRFVGKKAAKEIHDRGICLEEYLQ